jgi:hypothetical protein
MRQCWPIDPVKSVLALDEKICRARVVLQKTSEVNPAFEARVCELLRLVEERERFFRSQECRPRASA